MRRDAFQAISDPVRRAIIETLTVNSIAERFDISRPAISKHLKILKECGVITINKEGRERFCQIQPKNLIPAFLWIAQYEKLWEDKLDSFEEYLNFLTWEKNKLEWVGYFSPAPLLQISLMQCHLAKTMN